MFSKTDSIHIDDLEEFSLNEKERRLYNSRFETIVGCIDSQFSDTYQDFQYDEKEIDVDSLLDSVGITTGE